MSFVGKKAKQKWQLIPATNNSNYDLTNLKITTSLKLTYSKSTIEALEKGVKYVQS